MVAFVGWFSAAGAILLQILSLFHQQNILFYSDYVERTHHSEPIFFGYVLSTMLLMLRDGAGEEGGLLLWRMEAQDEMTTTMLDEMAYTRSSVREGKKLKLTGYAAWNRFSLLATFCPRSVPLHPSIVSSLYIYYYYLCSTGSG